MSQLSESGSSHTRVSAVGAAAQRAYLATPPAVLVLMSMVSVQLGAALAKGLFAELGPLGTVFLRVGSAALVLMLLWRPRLSRLSPAPPATTPAGASTAALPAGPRTAEELAAAALASEATGPAPGPLPGARAASESRPSRRDWWNMLLFGLTIALMNSLFYSSIARIPLGIAVTAEFVGPLAVALLQSRNVRDVAWAVLAAAGILLLAPIGHVAGDPPVDPLGLALALAAGVCWGVYILLNVRVGRAFRGGTGLALSMTAATVVIAPFGIASAGANLLKPALLLTGFMVGILSSFIPFSLELEALRRLPARVFGVLLSGEPALAVLIGWIVLSEAIQARELVAVLLITVASAGAAFLG
jgi:inner membrane transporter RhtA